MATRSFKENHLRWQIVEPLLSSVYNLRRAVTDNPTAGPCITGCRSVCWKAFLLYHDCEESKWLNSHDRSRAAYSSLNTKYMRYFNHPEALSNVASDPLADDLDSPWTSHRRDEILRAEIMQDVCRLPDEPFFHLDRIQALILDVLFVYCKTHRGTAGYRQGMHELLAPIVLVVEQDAIDHTSDIADPQLPGDVPVGNMTLMGKVLDKAFVEHDSYILFESLMKYANQSYAVGDGSFGSAGPIVERSKRIHERYLHNFDPELADYLTDLGILPQIFLIRWIRLLFGREFPMEQSLVLWDVIFAVDPELTLIDLICVAMLLRIRWTLLADGTTVLQQLLRYPVPVEPNGPHTFLEDAVYLSQHQTLSAGTDLILKYSGRPPALAIDDGSILSTSPRIDPQSPRAHSARSQGGVESLLQGAAKGVFERGERLGINQAVRDAVGELRRNMQNLGSGSHQMARPDLTAVEQRTQQLALVLHEVVDSLRSLARTGLDNNTVLSMEVIELAAARTQFVAVRLQDTTLDLSYPPFDHPPSPAAVSIPAAEPRTVRTPVHTASTTSTAAPTMAFRQPEPIPPRSTLAQSSFSFMLEPDEAPLTPRRTGFAQATVATLQYHTLGHRKQGAKGRGSITGNSSRDRHAFLFGEEAAKGVVPEMLSLEPVRAREEGTGRVEDG